MQKNVTRKRFIYVNFSANRHPLRVRALNDLVKDLNLEPNVEVVKFNASNQKEYWEALLDSQFVLSPPGII